MFTQLLQTLHNLPVVEKKAQILSQLAEGDLILSAETGSGKSLFTPAAWADMLQKAPNPRRSNKNMRAFGASNVIIVGVPRVLLAEENAAAVAEIAGVTLGREVGYATGDKDAFTPGVTRILFATWGTILARQIAKWGTSFAFDEVQEGQLLCTFVRALIHRRKAMGEDVRILEMSATMNAERQVGYWGKASNNVNIIHAEGNQYPITEQVVSPRQLETELRDLRFAYSDKDYWDVLTAYQAVKHVQEGRQGVLIFRPGHAGAESSAAWVEEICKAKGIPTIGASYIHGGMEEEERRAVVNALATGQIRILAGTQVIESGLNLKGQDAGVTCGKGREMTTNPATGKEWLDMVDLPQWRLTQMAGRTRRWRAGLLTLVSDTGFQARTLETRPEAERIPLEELVMQCAAYGVRASQLTYDCVVDMKKIHHAEVRMQRLGLVDEQFKLTPKGQFAQQLPTDPEVASSLFQARQQGILRGFLPIVAIMEDKTKTIRHNLSLSLAVREVSPQERTCEWLLELRAFYEVGRRLDFYATGQWDKLRELLGDMAAIEFDALRATGTKADQKKAKQFLFESLNVSKKKYWGAKEKHKKLLSSMGNYLEKKGQEKPMTATEVRRAILAGHVNDLYSRYEDADAKIISADGIVYGFAKASFTQLSSDFPMAMGKLTTITSATGGRTTFLSGVTTVSLEDLMSVFGESPAVLQVKHTRNKVGYFKFESHITYTLFGEYVVYDQFEDNSTPTAEEVANNAAYEAERARMGTILQTLNSQREELGLDPISLRATEFYLGYSGPAYAYTEKDVARAKADNTAAINAIRAKRTAAVDDRKVASLR